MGSGTIPELKILNELYLAPPGPQNAHCMRARIVFLQKASSIERGDFWTSWGFTSKRARVTQVTMQVNKL